MSDVFIVLDYHHYGGWSPSVKIFSTEAEAMAEIKKQTPYKKSKWTRTGDVWYSQVESCTVELIRGQI